MSNSKGETERLEALEGEIRDFVRRDLACLQRHPQTDSTTVSDNVSSLLQRVSANSVQEIDRILMRLEILRDKLSDEGARIQREIAEYASLSQAAMQSINVIAESLSLRKGPLTSAAPTKEPRGLPN
jgi:hypothetical protein